MWIIYKYIDLIRKEKSLAEVNSAQLECFVSRNIWEE